MEFFQMIYSSPIFSLIVLPLLIFIARVCDVTLGTIRIIMVSKGNKFISPLLGFFEVFIWLLAIGQIMQNLTNFYNYFAYSAGFAAGNYVGIKLEEKLAIGVLMVRMIIKDPSQELFQALRSNNYGATVVDAYGLHGKVNVIYCMIKRSNFDDIVRIIHQYHPKAFYSVEDVRLVREGIFPQGISWIKRRFQHSLQSTAKQK